MIAVPQAAVGTVAARKWVTDFVLLSAIWGSSFLFMRLATVEFGALPTAAVRVAIARSHRKPGAVQRRAEKMALKKQLRQLR